MGNQSNHKFKKSSFRAADASGVLAPSRMQIMAFLSEQNRPVSLAGLCKHFLLESDQEDNALTGRLSRLVKSGYLVVDRKKRYGLPEKMDILIGRVVGHSNGFGFVIPDKGGDDLYLHHKQMRRVLHGDRVLAKVKRIDHRGRKEGTIVEVVVEANREIIGRFHIESGIGFVEPDDSRFARDITIPGGHFNDAIDGDIVVLRIIKHPVEHQHAVGEIIEVVGRNLAPGMETEIALRKHEIPHDWPQSVSDQIQAMSKELNSVTFEKDRIDLRDIPLVTIDGIDAKDFDDAVFCESVGDGWRLLVAIADVSHYVKVNSALDLEAYNRGNSVYFPNRVIPMLPEALSNGICSLNPDQDRNCMVCDMSVDQTGVVTEYQFYPAVMRSQGRLTYKVVNKIVAEKDANQRVSWGALTPQLDILYSLFSCLHKKRQQRGSINFEIPEAYIEFDDKKRIKKISARTRNDAHKLIEEFMLAANVCAAQFVQSHLGENSIYRNHEGPDSEGLADLRRFLSGLGLSLGGGDKPKAADYSKLIDSVSARKDIAGVVQSVLLRSLSKAEYSTEQLGHFALAYPAYTHFTSPIRRYSDLVVHRQIKSILGDRRFKKAGPKGVSFGKIGEQCSFTERRADDATYDVIGWLKAEFMQERIGEEFGGIISGVKEFGIFVQLKDIFVDGLVHVTALGNDYYHFDPVFFQLTGERTGQRFRLGDHVDIRVIQVSLDDAKIDFELVTKEPAKSTKSTKPQKKHARKGRRKVNQPKKAK